MVERALADLDDDVARTGAHCCDEDVNRAADRHDLSILELGELRRRAAERNLTEAAGDAPPGFDGAASPSDEGDAARRAKGSLQWLLDQLHHFPLLDAGEEIELARSIENGIRAEQLLTEGPSTRSRDELERIAGEGLEAKKRMVACNIRLAIVNAKDFRGGGFDFEDLVQAAMPGLIRAAEKFDHRKGFKFSTYATWWIRQSISRALADTGRTIRLPVYVVERLNKFRAARSKLEGQLGREPTTEELAAQLDWELAEVTALTESIPTVVSLDAPISKDSAAPALTESLASESPSPYEQTVDALRAELVHDLLGKLEPRQRQVIELRHGLNDGNPLTLEEIGQRFQISRERVRQIEDEGIKTLRRIGREAGLGE